MERYLQIADSITTFFKGGELSVEELEALDRWVAEDEANRALFVSLCEGKNFEMRRVEYGTLDVDRAFQEVRMRRQRKRRVSSFRYAACAVAACLALFLVVHVIFFSRNDRKDVAERALVVAGGSRAWLTLDNGSKLALNDADTVLTLVNNTVVSRDGKLWYPGERDSVATEYNTLETPRGGEYRLALSDGTEVWLNANSKLTFPMYFTGDKRVVELSGEAYFEVNRDEKHPFIVKTSRSEVTVLGTHFCVRDYAGELNRTTLVAGSVRVNDLKGTSCVIKPGEQACTDGEGMEVKEVETYYYTAWKDGYFLFKEAPLEEIMSELAKWYDFEYFFVYSETADLTLSARLKKYDDIDHVLNILSKTGEVHFTRKGKTIVVWDDKR